MTLCEIFFKLKFSKCIQNIRTLESFGKFLLIVNGPVKCEIVYDKSAVILEDMLPL